MSTALAERLSDVVFVCVASTWFNGHIVGGAMPLGPQGIVAIAREHAPSWLPSAFDQGVLTAECESDAEIRELLELVRRGRATVLPAGCVRFVHVAAGVTRALRMDDGSTDDGSTDDGSSDDGSSDAERDGTPPPSPAVKRPRKAAAAAE